MDKSLFNGDSYRCLLALIIYKQLRSGDWVTYKGVMDIYNPKESHLSLHDRSNYSVLKKVFPEVCHAISEKAGKGSIIEEGNLKNKKFKYVGKEDNPLEDMINAKTVEDLKHYWKFCQDSAGFFPTSWLEYFFKNTHDLLGVKKRKGKQVLNASLDRMLTNIELLPVLYNAIINEIVLSFDYKPFYKEAKTLVFHPQFLKEYNGRWHLFGLAEGEPYDFGFDVALDRIDSNSLKAVDKKWIPAPKDFYESFFKDIVGVSHDKFDNTPKEIHLRAHTNYIFNMIDTKKIHNSQEMVLPFGKHEDGEYGDFTIQTEINKELIGAILQLGPDLEVISPSVAREIVRSKVQNMLRLYEDTK